ncbi:transcriptional regulator [Natrinema sp. HArc-T2]|uniref:DUF7527 domain-containing protein n=1 Tax=Natrinema sp. HArc-T2 TaxID=3242701 RepID=UPI00359D59ED
MDPRTQERVEEWDSRPFTGGFDGLSDLAHADFSGVVSAVGTWLCMLNGRIVGIIDGDIDDFETASGTCYEAPHPSLPLLCTMEEQGGETRAKYYTNETALREVDNTLQSGSFTGYVELSENVLSGDYYAVYYGGRRMAAAYIGNAERLLTGEEAFDRAADEVGIYEVIDVEIDVVDVPGTDSASEADPTTESAPSDTAVEAGAPSTTSDDGSEPDSAESSIEPIDISSTDAVDAADVSGADSTEAVTDESAQPSEIDPTDDPSGITATDSSEGESEPPSAGITESGPADDAEPASAAETSADDETRQNLDQDAPLESEPTDSDSVSTPVASAGEPSTLNADGATDPDLEEIEAAAEVLDRNGISWVDDDDEPATGLASESATESETTATGDGLEEEFEREEEWRETRRIPSIDPDNSDSATDSSTGGRELRMDQPSATSDANADETSSAVQSDTQPSDRTAASTPSTPSTAGSSDSREDGSRAQGARTQTTTTDAHSEQVATLTEKVETLQEQRDSLATKAEELEAERDRLHAENDDLSATVERLQSRIDDLETELEQAQSRVDDSATSDAGTQLSPQQALSQTNLFVRYASKSQPTLETAHDGDADRSEVASNLRLEHHTGFDSSDAVVDGKSYDDFLETTMEHRFVDWLTEMLLYEIRDTGNADGLGDLYDAIPRIDRAELGATISLADDDTEDVPEQVTFDIVAFDKMGNPLLLVTLNDSREPATKDLLAELEEAASAVKANYPDLAAAIAVTSSYFEPGALEVAEQATSSGFLSRSSKLSYVNLSRKSGYHLCLVESRSEGFHMNVPEL